MKKLISLFCLFFLLVSFTANDEPKAIKFACIGDSITDGDGLADRRTEAYPAILANILGENYQVVNFGKSGATQLRRGDWPYWEKPAYKEALAFEPDIVTVLLGANDSKPQNIPSYPDEYINDLRDMVDSLQLLPSHPVVYLCKPVPVYENRFHINDSVLLSDVIPAIEQVAVEKNCKIIDLHTAFTGKREYFPDGVHPNKEGAVAIAEAIAAAIHENSN